MPKLAREYNYRDYYQKHYASVQELPRRTYINNHGTKTVRPAEPKYVKPKSKKVQRNNTVHRIISVLFLTAVAAFVFPITYNRVIKSFFHKSPYPAIKADYQKILNPTLSYLHNDLFLDTYFLKGAETKNPQMLTLTENQRLRVLKIP